MLKRIEEAKKFIRKFYQNHLIILKMKTFNTDYEHVGYVKTKKEMKDRWRQQLKFSTLSNYDDIYTRRKTS